MDIDVKQDRQMPSTDAFLKNINIVDLIYGYYQKKAQYDEKADQMYCYKTDVAKNTMYNYFKETNPQVKIGKTKIGTAIDIINELYIDREDRKGSRPIYWLKTLNRNESIDIRYATLVYLLANCNSNIIKIYVYLKMKYTFHQIYNQEEDYCFSISELILMLGYGEGSLRTQEIRTMVQLNVSHLVQMGLIEYEDITKTINGAGVPYKRLIKVNELVKEVDSVTKRLNANLDIVTLGADPAMKKIEDTKLKLETLGF